MPAVILFQPNGGSIVLQADEVSWNFDKVGLNDYNILGGLRAQASDDGGQQRVWSARGRLFQSGTQTGATTTPLAQFNAIDTQMQIRAGSFQMHVNVALGEGAGLGSYYAVNPQFSDGTQTGGAVVIKNFRGKMGGTPQYLEYELTFSEVSTVA